jgi:hypothetical protein
VCERTTVGLGRFSEREEKVKAIWVFVAVEALIGSLVIVQGLLFAETGEQQLFRCALGLALSVIPYIFARAVQEIVR